MSDELAVGIDLGTTYSVVARLDASGVPEAIPNAEGDRITPSAVLFDGEDVVVGKEAIKAMVTEAPNVAECSKRDVGYAVFHKVIGGKHYPPEVIEAWILNKLRVDASARIGPVRKAVITVPAYFDEVRRKATQDAGYMAGLEVLDIINEPTAAAVAYGYQKGLLEKTATAERPMRILVYDLGGGTFDVTVMEIRGNRFITQVTDGDVRLGGHDWDQRLVDLVAERFLREHYIDPREDPAAAGKLWLECEDAKRTLSARSKASIACDCQGRVTRVEITRAQFEDATRDLVDRTRFTVGQALAAARVSWKQIDRLLLVGGATRMPMVRTMLREISGLEPDGSVAADEAVALGAALRAAQLVPQGRHLAGQFKIKNVNSHSLGVVGTDRATGRRRNGILIPRNTPIPVAARRVFKTQKDSQQSILVQVVEGESGSADECTQIGQCTVRGLPPDLPSGWPVEVQFRYKPDGRLGVRVMVRNMPGHLETEFSRQNGLSQEHLDGWRRYISGLEPPEA